MRKGIIGFLAICFFMCIFFRGGTEVDEQAYVISMGLDKAQGDRLLLTLELPSVSDASPGKGSTPSNQGAPDKYQIVEAEANTIIDAVEMIRSLVPDNLNFTQTLQIIASEEYARSDQFLQVIENLMLVNDIRKSSAFLICRGKANAYIRAQKPFLGIRLSEDIKTGLEVYERMGFIPSASLGEAFHQMKSGWQDALLPMAAVNDSIQSDSTGELDIKTGRILDTTAGMAQNSGDKKTDLLGAAVFQKGRMVGTITGFEVQLLTYLLGDMKQFTYYFDGCYYRMVNRLPARLKAVKTGDQWVFKVSGGIRVNPLECGHVDVERLTDAFNNEILQVIWKLQKLGADPIGFQGRAVRTVTTLAEWQSVDWMDIYQNASTEVKTDIAVGRES